MKNYRLILVAILGLFISCSPSEEKTEKLKFLVAEWKNTSDKVISLSEKIGDQAYLLEVKKADGDTTEMLQIDFNGEQTNCEAEYSTMRTQIDEFIEVWRENSLKVDELTNNMSIGKWTNEDDENLRALDLEVKKSDANIELWEEELNELSQKCGLNSEGFVIQEQEN
ncbi:hypothetical protein [Algoriphagus yeomjeoni]|uniref:Uncharacterized protein n=1 Tax=Algoriphagus yeomjeoni TaxID=291403 RepID=A0A327PVB7_9BACT|nr:hypothetical protein [Algoriphagus yeomjeoni]RAI95251.1 hypothetical protein LV83_00502 [Algoriphagus yeomjeoni]